MIFTDSLKIDLLGISVALLAVLVAWFRWNYGHWERKGVAGPKPIFLFGTGKDFFLGKKHLGEYYKDLYFEYKAKGARFVGTFLGWQPTFVITDIDLIKSTLQADFQHFHSHGSFVDEKVNPLSPHLFNLDGPKWRESRSKLTPTFTSGKMKMMHQVLVECSEQLRDHLKNNCKTNPVEIRDIMARYTTNIIGSCAFGLEMNSLQNADAEFRIYGAKIFESSVSNLLRLAAPMFLNDKILKLVGFRGLDQGVIDFFYNSIDSTVKYREENQIVRKDFLNLLIQLKNSSNEKERMSLSDMTAHSFVFFAAGFETSSTTINFACYELCRNPDIQEKLREEINRVLAKHDNQLTYEAVTEMNYLDRVISETLRMYPPLTFLFRVCTKTYKVPGENFVIDEGTRTMIPVMGIHRDPEFYPNPDQFDPDRFTEENKKKRPAFAYLPFGEGPRICIGLRFGVHQTKLGLITLLQNFKIKLNEKTRSPLVFSKSGFILASADGMWLDLEPIKA